MATMDDYDAWYCAWEPWYESQGLLKTRLHADLPADGDLAAMWSGVDVGHPHPSLEDLGAVSSGVESAPEWFDALFGLAGEQLLQFPRQIGRSEFEWQFMLTTAEVRKALRLGRANLKDQTWSEKRQRVDELLGLASLPANPFVVMTELNTLLNCFERTRDLLKQTRVDWLKVLAWQRGVPLDDLGATVGRSREWVRQAVGGTPPPRPVVSLSWWEGEKARRANQQRNRVWSPSPRTI